MADDLIDHLAADLTPTPRRALPARLFGLAGLGVVVSAVLMLAWLGLRPDLMIAVGTMMFWVKFAFTAIFAALGAVAALNLARPGGSMVRQAVGVVTLVALTGACQRMRQPRAHVGRSVGQLHGAAHFGQRPIRLSLLAIRLRHSPHGDRKIRVHLQRALERQRQGGDPVGRP